MYKKKKSETPLKTRFKKNDLVFVRAGKSRGKTGRILRIDSIKGRAFVQGLSMVKKAMRPNQQNEKGGIIEKESSIHLSNLMIFSERSNQSGRMGVKIKGDKKIRVIRKNKKEIEI